MPQIWLRPFIRWNLWARAARPVKARTANAAGCAAAVNAALTALLAFYAFGPIRLLEQRVSHACRTRHCRPADRRIHGTGRTSHFHYRQPGRRLRRRPLPRGQPCGKAAATAYCKSRDFQQAVSFQKVDKDEITGAIPVTPASACRGGSCDRYVAIVCSR